MKFKVLLLILSLGMSPVAFCVGHVNDVKITSVYCGYPDTYNMCSVEFDTEILERDTCHTMINAKRMQFKADTEIGKALLSIALTAHASQKNVDIYSTGKCTIYSGLSDINFIKIKS